MFVLYSPTGLRIGMGLSHGKGIATRWFSKKFPIYSLEHGVTIYIPVKYNFRMIDALILSLDTVGDKVMTEDLELRAGI